jgi:hypothetical protein
MPTSLVPSKLLSINSVLPFHHPAITVLPWGSSIFLPSNQFPHRPFQLVRWSAATQNSRHTHTLVQPTCHPLPHRSHPPRFNLVLLPLLIHHLWTTASDQPTSHSAHKQRSSTSRVMVKRVIPLSSRTSMSHLAHQR